MGLRKEVFLIGAAFFATVHSSLAQSVSVDNVPQTVTNAFKGKFPSSKKNSWELDYDQYAVNFSMGRNVFLAKFDKSGTWLETKSFIKPSKLPKVIKQSIAKKYGILNSYEIVEAEKIEHEKETLYIAEIRRGTEIYELEIDEAGEVLKEEKK